MAKRRSGESWRQAVDRVGDFLEELAERATVSSFS
jgi:broad specificity phosphatase PhoE